MVEEGDAIGQVFHGHGERVVRLAGSDATTGDGRGVVRWSDGLTVMCALVVEDLYGTE